MPALDHPAAQGEHVRILSHAIATKDTKDTKAPKTRPHERHEKDKTQAHKKQKTTVERKACKAGVFSWRVFVSAGFAGFAFKTWT
jgi:hypothetical protein